MHSVVSDRRLGLDAEIGSDQYARRDAKFATADITDFYLGTPGSIGQNSIYNWQKAQPALKDGMINKERRS